MSKKTGIIILALLFCCGVAVLSRGLAVPSSSKGDEIVLYIDDIPVTVDQWRQAAGCKVNEVKLYFQNQGNINVNDPDFWENSYGGEQPFQRLHNEALTVLLNRTILLKLAQQKGLIQDIRYEAIRRKWESENNSRSAAVANKKVLYGPVQLDLDAYYRVLIGELTNKLLLLMSKDELHLTNEKLRELYEQRKTNEFDIMHMKTGQLIISKSVPDAEEKLVKVIRLGKQGDTLQEAARTIGMAKAYKLEDYDEKNMSSRDTHQASVFNQLKSLSRGQFSEQIDLGDSIMIAECLQKDEDYKSLDEVKGYLTSMYLQEQFRSYINDRIQHASAINKISEDALNRMLNGFLRE
ncbi:hypothetical protein [Cohnella silvisoli]|uniref:Peptidylprolyl isomerase n=1 Tax=Cohnella silvisoli TaxID=2873699 RepID=A0ABV1L0C1_9BACL|nr:hypothetical protein [Cohnella silvisoli]MCD9024902.1 hypothetical protein [Cohnella silvisoli]